MPGASLFALLDDITTVLDDVALLTKVAAKKTAGVLGDDLALNAEQVAGVRADRELPVVWAVAKGSLLNKVILVPVALVISAVAPWAITPLLMVGGAFLCFEGCEKLAHKFLRGKGDESQTRAHLSAVADPAVDLVKVERDKIKGAVRTDFVLSAEIVTIALGTVANAPFGTRVAVLCGLSLLMTVGVYGLVAGIVKLDDLGFYLQKRGAPGSKSSTAAAGRLILRFAPWLMKALSVAGTFAMFLVGGGILSHGIPFVHDLVYRLTGAAHALGGVGAILALTVPSALDMLVGLVAGGVVLAVVTSAKRLLGRAH